MTSIHARLAGLMLALSGLWLVSGSHGFDLVQMRGLSEAWRLYSGVVGMGAMSAAMVLAARPGWLVRLLGGADSLNSAHMGLGIAGMIAMSAHWLGENLPHWLRGLGQLAEGGQAGAPGAHVLGGTDNGLLKSLHEPAAFLGEFGFYAMGVLILFALILKVLPPWFAHVHSWLAIIYLALVFHGVVLMPVSDWTQPIGLAMALMMVSGVIAAGIVARRRLIAHMAPEAMHSSASAACKAN